MITLSLSLALLSSCEGTNAFVSTGGSYEVSASVGGKVLAAGATISSSSDIAPAFASSIAEDPDAAGLSVYLEDLRGKVVSRPVEYRTKDRTSTGLASAKRVTLAGLSGEIPPFRFPASISPGFYRLCFQVLGATSVLAEQRLPVFYRSDAVLSLNELHTWPPGDVATESQPLLPVGVPLLFDLDIVADKRLDPCVIWTLSGREIARGRLSEGANRIFWTAPSGEALYTLKAEVLPVVPSSSDPCIPVGESLSVVVATSPKVPLPGLSLSPASCAHWFRFSGDLLDSTQPGLAFRPIADHRAVWAPVAANYGLEISHESSWFLPVPPTALKAGPEGDCVLSLLCSVQAPGSLFRASYALQDGSSLSVELSIQPAGFELRLVNGDSVASRILKESFSFGREAWQPDTLLSLRGNTLSATLSCGGSMAESVSLRLPAAPVGTGSLTLGGRGSTTEDYILPSQAVSVIDELAIY